MTGPLAAGPGRRPRSARSPARWSRWCPGPPASATAGSARSTRPARCATGCPAPPCSARRSGCSPRASASATTQHARTPGDHGLPRRRRPGRGGARAGAAGPDGPARACRLARARVRRGGRAEPGGPALVPALGFRPDRRGHSNLRTRTAVITASAALAVVVMPKGGTVDVSAIIQAVLCAAAVAGSAVLFELLPGRGRRRRSAAVLGGPRPAPRVPVGPRRARCASRDRPGGRRRPARAAGSAARRRPGGRAGAASTSARSCSSASPARRCSRSARSAPALPRSTTRSSAPRSSRCCATASASGSRWRWSTSGWPCSAWPGSTWAGRCAAARRAPHRPRLLRIAALWGAPLVVCVPLFSRDLYAYAAQAQIAHAGLDPYSVGPVSLPGPFLDEISGMWVDTPAPYGPLFLGLGRALATVTGDRVVTTVLCDAAARRGRRAADRAATCPGWPRAAGGDPRIAVWLGIANPLVLVHFVAGGHNDALMIGLLVAGLTIAIEAHRGALGRRRGGPLLRRGAGQGAGRGRGGVPGLGLGAAPDRPDGAAAGLRADRGGRAGHARRDRPARPASASAGSTSSTPPARS